VLTYKCKLEGIEFDWRNSEARADDCFNLKQARVVLSVSTVKPPPMKDLVVRGRSLLQQISGTFDLQLQDDTNAKGAID